MSSVELLRSSIDVNNNLIVGPESNTTILDVHTSELDTFRNIFGQGFDNLARIKNNKGWFYISTHEPILKTGDNFNGYFNVINDGVIVVDPSTLDVKFIGLFPGQLLHPKIQMSLKERYDIDAEYAYNFSILSRSYLMNRGSHTYDVGSSLFALQSSNFMTVTLYDQMCDVSVFPRLTAKALESIIMDISYQDFILIMYQLLDAYQKAYNQLGYVHNDFGPHNILIIEENSLVNIEDKQIISRFRPVIIDYNDNTFDSDPISVANDLTSLFEEIIRTLQEYYDQENEKEEQDEPEEEENNEERDKERDKEDEDNEEGSQIIKIYDLSEGLRSIASNGSRQSDIDTMFSRLLHELSLYI